MMTHSWFNVIYSLFSTMYRIIKEYYYVTSTNPCTHGKAILIVKEMSPLIIAVFCKYNLMYAFQ